MNFSNMTIDEYIRINRDIIPAQMIDLFEGYADKYATMQKELDVAKRKGEVLSEQIYFARELLGQIDEFVEDSKLSWKAKTQYDTIKENSMFEY